MALESRPKRGGPPLGNCLILLAFLGAIGYIWWLRTHPPAPGSGGGDGFFGRGGSTSAGTADILFFYGRSTRKWMEQAAEEFNREHDCRWRIVLETKGSREGKQEILYEKGRPVLWSPADVYWTDKLNLD